MAANKDVGSSENVNQDKHDVLSQFSPENDFINGISSMTTPGLLTYSMGFTSIIGREFVGGDGNSGGWAQ